MSESDIPREPDHYHPTDHAVQRQKERGFEWNQVAETIQNGEVWSWLDDNVAFFVQEFPGHDYPLAVVANTDSGEIITVEWRR